LLFESNSFRPNSDLAVAKWFLAWLSHFMVCLRSKQFDEFVLLAFLSLIQNSLDFLKVYKYGFTIKCLGVSNVITLGSFITFHIY